jgi:hypothetical protein
MFICDSNETGIRATCFEFVEASKKEVFVLGALSQAQRRVYHGRVAP